VFDALRVITLMILVAILACWYLSHYTHQPLPHRERWELDPQGQSENFDEAHCRPPRVPYRVEISPGHDVFVYCIRGTN
jgi:hypothetical protein